VRQLGLARAKARARSPGLLSVLETAEGADGRRYDRHPIF